MWLVRGACGLVAMVVWLSAAWSQQASPAAAAPPAGRIDAALSRVYVHVGGVRLGHEHAIEGRVREGSVQLGAAQQAGSMVFDMNSFVADSDQCRELLGLDGTMSQSTQESVTRTMLGDRVLDAKQHPTATFTIDSALPLELASERGLPQYELSGTLEWHGVKRPLKFVVDVDQSKPAWRVRGKFPLVQTEYGIKPYSAAFGAVAVADELTIHGDVMIHGK